MPAPPHDPELFDELMRTELSRQPVNRFAIATLVSGLLGGLLAPVFGIAALLQIRDRRERGRNLAIAGLVAFVGWAGVFTYQAVTGTAWWQQPPPPQERMPEGMAHGFDLAVGECFWAPAASGYADVLQAACTEPHNAEAFEVLPLGDGPMPDIVEIYHGTLARCQADALRIPDVRIQVVTPTSFSWQDGKHRAVCYYHFATDMTRPAR